MKNYVEESKSPPNTIQGNHIYLDSRPIIFKLPERNFEGKEDKSKSSKFGNPLPKSDDIEVNFHDSELPSSISPPFENQLDSSEDIDDINEKNGGCIHSCVTCPSIFVFYFLSICIGALIWVAIVSDISFTSPSNEDFLVKFGNETSKSDLLTIAGNTISAGSKNTIIPQWTVHLIFQTLDSQSIFTQNNIKRMRQITNEITKIPGIDSFCLKNLSDLSRCSDNFVRGIIFDFSPDFDDNDILSTLRQYTQLPSKRIFLPKEFNIVNLTTTYTKVIFSFGSPISNEQTYNNVKYNFSSSDDNFNIQNELYKKIASKIDAYVLSLNDEKMSVYAYSKVLYELLYINRIKIDTKYMIFAMIFIPVYVAFIFRSLIVTIISLIYIFASFPLSYAIYNQFMQIQYLGACHLIAAYINIINSTAYIMIFMDNWKHTRSYKKKRRNLLKKVKYVFKRSISPATVTTIGSIISHFSLIYSGIVPVSTFGIASGILLIVNYLLLILFFPGMLIIYKKYFKKFLDLYRLINKLVNPEKYQLLNQVEVAKKNTPNVLLKKLPEGQEQKGENPDKSFGCFETCCGRYYSAHRKLGFVYLIIIIAWFAYNIYLSTYIKAFDTPDYMLPSSDNIVIAKKYVEYGFRHGEGDLNVVVNFIFGINELDISNSKYFSNELEGSVNWASNIDWSLIESQKFLRYSVCQNLIHNQSKLVQDEQSVVCFLIDFYKWVSTSNHSSHLSTPADDGTYYINKDYFIPALKDFMNAPEGDYYKFQHLVNFDQSGNLKFVVIFAEAIQVSKDLQKQQMNDWKQVAINFNQLSNSGNVKTNLSCIQTAKFTWAFLDSERALKNAAIIGIVLGSASYAISILVATRNALISIFTFVSISVIVIIQIGLLYFFGYSFGILESIMSIAMLPLMFRNISIVATHYGYSKFPTRRFKAKETLMKASVSIFHNSLFSFLSSWVIYLSVCIMISKFSLLFVFVILYIFICSLFFMHILLMYIGPNKNFMDVYNCLSHCYEHCEEKAIQSELVEEIKENQKMDQRESSSNNDESSSNSESRSPTPIKESKSIASKMESSEKSSGSKPYKGSNKSGSDSNSERKSESQSSDDNGNSEIKKNQKSEKNSLASESGSEESSRNYENASDNSRNQKDSKHISKNKNKSKNVHNISPKGS